MKTVSKIEEKLADIKEKQDVISTIEEEEAVVTVKLKEDYEIIDGRSFAEIKSSDWRPDQKSWLRRNFL